jgi:chromate transporter
MQGPTGDDRAQQRRQMHVSRWSLFSGFVLVGLLGFGGIGASLFHVLVERRRWLTAEEYASTLGLGQVLPGANLINLTTIVGDRYYGLQGAALALSGLMLMPLIVLLGLTTVYDLYADLPDVKAAIAAAAAGAVGLTWGTALKLGRIILRSPGALVFALASFAAIGLLRLPMALTIVTLAPIAIAAGFWKDRT